jgi:hypothetical protein
MDGRMVEATSFPIYLREGSPVSFAEKAGWAPETVCMIKENKRPSGRLVSWTIQS